MAKVTQKDFYPIAYAGLLGGAAVSISDQILTGIVPDGVVESLGLTFKDIVTIYGGVWLSKNHAKKAWQKQAAEGMSIIAVYKTLYPRFLEPTVAGFMKKGVSNPGNPNPGSSYSSDALARMM